MTPYDSDWEQSLKASPFQKKFFTEQHIHRVQEKVARISTSPRRRAWIYVSLPIAVVCLAIVLALMKPDVMESVVQRIHTWVSAPELKEPSPSEPQPVIDPEESYDEHDLQEIELPPVEHEHLEPGNYLRFKGTTVAWDYPDYWFGYNVFEVNPGQDYELLAVDGSLVQIRVGENTGWLPLWYIEEDESDRHRITDVEPYEMIVGHSTMIHAYPDEEAPTLFELEVGRVVQVKQQYEDWVAVEIRLYAEPISGAMWLPFDALVSYDEGLAKEGYFRLNRGGTPIYRDLEQNVLVENITRKRSARIVEEHEEMYMISAPGGISGYIIKDDFIPKSPR